MAKKIEEATSSLEALYQKYDENRPIIQKGLDYKVKERLATPFMSMHKYLGGGPAVGKVTTYSGLFSTGKTSLCLEIAGYNKDAVVGFVDCEYNWVEFLYVGF